MWGVWLLLQAGHLEHPWKKENRLAMHQPVGVRKEVLQVVTEHIGRCAAQCDSESNPGVGSATKGADSKMFARHDIVKVDGNLDTKHFGPIWSKASQN